MQIYERGGECARKRGSAESRGKCSALKQKEGKVTDNTETAVSVQAIDEGTTAH